MKYRSGMKAQGIVRQGTASHNQKVADAQFGKTEREEDSHTTNSARRLAREKKDHVKDVAAEYEQRVQHGSDFETNSENKKKADKKIQAPATHLIQ